MTNLKTRPELLEALQRASTRELSASVLHDQRVSFVMSSLNKNSDVTRDRVEREVAKQDGSGRD